MTTQKNKIFKWFKVAVICYCGIGILLYYLQDKILLHPNSVKPDYQYKFSTSFKELTLPINKKDTIHLVQFLPNQNSDASESKGLVLYFHGGNGNITHYSENVVQYTKNGFEVWMPDYPGFGKSVGELDEMKLYEEAYQVKRLAENKYKEEQIIILGTEFGAAIAANLAASSRVKHLILESPYVSIPNLLSTYLPIYPWSSMCHFKMPTSQFLQDVKCPVTVFAADNNALKLKPFLKKNDRVVIVKESSELELSKTKAYNDIVLSVLKDSTSLSR